MDDLKLDSLMKMVMWTMVGPKEVPMSAKFDL